MKVRITDALKSKLIELNLIEKDADDSAIETAATDAIMTEKLAIAELKELQKDPDGDNGSKMIRLLEKLVDQRSTPAVPPASKDSPVDSNAVNGNEKDTLPSWAKDGGLDSVMGKFNTTLGSAEEKTGFHVDVKKVKDMYSDAKEAPQYPSTTKTGQSHPFAGQSVFEFTDAGKRQVSGTSELEKAVNGAYLKLTANMQMKNVPRAMRLTDHDKELLKYAMNEMKWGGVLRGSCDSDPGSIAVKNRRLTGMEVKTVIDDIATGGLEIAPISFDDQVITIPLLFGELAPFVNMVPITRGRRIESATLGNMSLTSAGSVVDDTAIPLFATAGFISAFDTTIHVVHGAIEIGLDLMSDSPIDIAGHVTTKYGELLLAWLDEQIAIGDGVVEPEGIMVAAGTTAVSFGGVAATLGGYEAQLFGVPKRYKQGFDRSRLRFAANETTYSRARGIPVGAADARRLYGMNEENYSIFDHGFSIVDTMTNLQGFFANLARYRMYRRLGLTMNMTMEGRELTLRNKMLITSRARYGGRLEDGNAAAVTVNHLA